MATSWGFKVRAARFFRGGKKRYFTNISLPLPPSPSLYQDIPSSGRFERIFNNHKGRLVNKWKHYLPIYDQIFSSYYSDFKLTNRKLRFLEIGVSHGGSLQMWRSYFGPNADIRGMDIDPRCQQLDSKDLPVFIGSQTDGKLLESIVSQMGGVDIVLDDGSHVASHQISSFETLFPLLSEGGLYVIEDTHTAYWPDFEGGLERDGTIIEYCKKMIDGLHGNFFDVSSNPLLEVAHSSIASVSFFDSIIVIKKQARDSAVNQNIGLPSF